MITVETAIWTVLAVQIVGGIGLRIFAPKFRSEANGLLGLAAAEILIPATVFAIAAFGFWLHPPQPTSDALGPSPWWPALLSSYISLLLLGVAAIILLKVVIQSALVVVRKLENKKEDNQALHGTAYRRP